MEKRAHKKQKSNKTRLFLPIFIALIMITSILGFMHSPDTEQQYKYNGHLFTQTDKGWVTYVNNRPLSLAYDPQSLESISIDDISLSELNSAQKTYLSTNPEDNLNQVALYNFQQNIIPLLSTRLVTSCTVDIPKCSEKPIKTCEDASDDVKVVILESSNQTAVKYKDNCLIIQGKNQNLTQATDKLTLKLWGII